MDPDSAEANGGAPFVVQQSPQKNTTEPGISIEQFATLLDSRMSKFATRDDFDKVIEQVKENEIVTRGNKADIMAIRAISSPTKKPTWAQRLINLEIPVLVRSLKSSNVELG